MGTSKKEEPPKSPESNNDPDFKRPKLWGTFYLLLGLLGLGFAVYSIFYDIKNIVPLYGTVMAGALIGALSLLIIIFGYRIIKKDY